MCVAIEDKQRELKAIFVESTNELSIDSRSFSSDRKSIHSTISLVCALSVNLIEYLVPT